MINDNKNKFELPQIQIESDKVYTILKIVLLVTGFSVIMFNVLNAHAVPIPINNTSNSTVIDLGTLEITGTDSDQKEEEQDEKLHEDESKDWSKLRNEISR